jgi:DNA-binding NarL/FixJ family response regulator
VQQPFEVLTTRERQLLQLLVMGRQTKEIAAELHPPCKTETVKSHLRDIYTKLGVHNRTEATAWYLHLGPE